MRSEQLLRRAGRLDTFYCRELCKIVSEELEAVRTLALSCREMRKSLKRAREASILIGRAAEHMRAAIEEVEALADGR